MNNRALNGNIEIYSLIARFFCDSTAFLSGFLVRNYVHSVSFMVIMMRVSLSMFCWLLRAWLLVPVQLT